MMNVPYGGNKDENNNGQIDKSEAVKFYSNGKADDKVVSLIKLLKSWYDEGLITTTDMVAKVSNNSDAGVWDHYTYNQETLIYVNGSKNAWYGSANMFRGKVIQTPTIDDGMLNLESGKVTNKSAKSKAMSQGANIVFFDHSDEENQASWLFYKFLTNPANSAQTALTMSSMPIRSSSYDESSIKDAMSNADKFPEAIDFTSNETINSGANQSKNFDYLQSNVYKIYQEYDKNNQTFIAPVSTFSQGARTAIKNMMINIFSSEKTGSELDSFINSEVKAAYENI